MKLGFPGIFDGTFQPFSVAGAVESFFIVADIRAETDADIGSNGDLRRDGGEEVAETLDLRPRPCLIDRRGDFVEKEEKLGGFKCFITAFQDFAIRKFDGSHAQFTFAITLSIIDHNVDAVVKIGQILDDFQSIGDKCFVHFLIGIAELNAAGGDALAADLHIIFRMGIAENFFGKPAGTHIVTAAEFKKHTVIGVTAVNGKFIIAGHMVDTVADTVDKKFFAPLGDAGIGKPAAHAENGIVKVVFDLKFQIGIKGQGGL